MVPGLERAREGLVVSFTRETARVRNKSSCSLIVSISCRGFGHWDFGASTFGSGTRDSRRERTVNLKR